MPTDPFTGTIIPPGARTVHCPHGHVHLPDSWQAAGNRCCFPGCTYVGNSIADSGGSGGSDGHRGWLWLGVLLGLCLGGYGIAALSRSGNYAPTPTPWQVEVIAPTQTPIIQLAPTKAPAVSPAPTRAPVAVPTEDPWPTLQATIVRFADIKTQATRTLDGSQYSTVLRGAALDYYLNALNVLRGNNCYWLFSNRNIRFGQWEMPNPNYAVVYATIQETADLYCNNTLDRGSYYVPYGVRFEMEQVSGRWYISNRTVLDQ
jgi:hypothetical protein